MNKIFKVFNFKERNFTWSINYTWLPTECFKKQQNIRCMRSFTKSCKFWRIKVNANIHKAHITSISWKIIERPNYSQISSLMSLTAQALANKTQSDTLNLWRRRLPYSHYNSRQLAEAVKKRQIFFSPK